MMRKLVVVLASVMLCIFAMQAEARGHSGGGSRPHYGGGHHSGSHGGSYSGGSSSSHRGGHYKNSHTGDQYTLSPIK